MINFIQANLKSLATGFVGNKLCDEGFSKPQFININEDELIRLRLLNHLLAGVRDTNNCYSLKKEDNEFLKIVTNIFTQESINEESVTSLMSLLYEKDSRLKKGKRFFVSYITDALIDGELVDAIGLFLMSDKDAILSYDNDKIQLLRGTSYQKIESSAIVFNYKNIEEENICVFTEKGTTWQHDCFRAEVLLNNYSISVLIMKACLAYIRNRIQINFEINLPLLSKLLYRNYIYFKHNESFYSRDYAATVFENKDVTLDFIKFLQEEYADIPEFEDGLYDIDKEAYKAMRRCLSADVNIGHTGISVNLKKEPKIDIIKNGEERYYQIKIQ